MNESIRFDQMLQKQQLNLVKLQQRLNEMKKEYEIYKDVIDKLKSQMTPTTKITNSAK